jgi:hypothetical protein
VKKRSDTSTPEDKRKDEAPNQPSPRNYLRSETENPLEEPHHQQKIDNLRLPQQIEEEE